MNGTGAMFGRSRERPEYRYKTGSVDYQLINILFLNVQYDYT